MTDSERLKIAQEVLAHFEWDDCGRCYCVGEQPYTPYPATRDGYDDAHAPGCRWMIAMGKRDA
jgi:hypothetical protein